MAIDPAADSRAAYDYASEDVERPDLVDALSRVVDGDVRFDTYTRQLYATDASAYEVTPIGVVFPQRTADVEATVSYCADHDVPVLPRGGGTSLAGQTVNEAVVLDFSRYMDSARSVSPDDRLVTAQPGIKLGDLNARLAEHGLKFAPDPAWGDKSALGGAIGNNSSGSHSLVYGKTDAYVESLEVVLADGTRTTFGQVSVEELRERADPDGDREAQIYAELERILDEDSEEIDARYPDMKRNVSGYNLDYAFRDADPDGGVVNVAALLAGSEGTLGVITEATVSLEPVPETKAVALFAYDDLVDAVSDVAPMLEHDPAAVELVDDVLLDLAADTEEFADVVGMLPEGTGSALLVEFYADSDDHGKQQVADVVADRAPGTDTEFDASDDRATADAPVFATRAMEAHDEEQRSRFWKMRKAGMPILLSRTSDEKHISFIEDCAVPPERLPEYVQDFQDVLEAHDTFASFYAHAGPGVLHVRPLVNTKAIDGAETMQSISDAVTDLVVEYGGSVSGEHGDGRARTQWNKKLYGDRLWRAFRDLKSAFDPDWLLNPGQVCGFDDPASAESAGLPERATAVSMTENLRYGADYEFDAGFEPTLSWANENGFQGMADLCHGCGGCRGSQDTTGGVMCPTYRAADEEIQATRGRANLLRQAMSGDLPEDEQFSEEFVTEVLDLCIGCKGCSRDCPSEVDMAKMKAELTHEHHQREGASVRSKLFADIDALCKLGSATAPVSNLATKLPGARELGERVLGISKSRTLPSFTRETFRDWFDARGGSRVPETDADHAVVLVADTYSNYCTPAPAKAAVRVLEAAGVHVSVADRTDVGRPAFSKGFLDRSRERAEATVAELAPAVDDGKDVVLVEPSDAVMLQSDYRDLLDGPAMERVSDHAYGVLEYLDRHRLDEELDLAGDGSLAYHGHCHQKSTKKDHHAVGVLRRAGYRVNALDSGCCGMAGSFGYEAEHHSMSMAIGELLEDQVSATDVDEVVAPGASCRTQLHDLPDAPDDPRTPVEALADALGPDA
ncbi:FAD-binding and (Fe-S)-binding domain-containing protein [Salarchaeum sp. JOR-1]|uniref:FAD-binding and (Fe-S)-binding domain-containing protein n=1 Tax=Salarchaeum sp. JOR-1 TaxID=2599399 RepID=UPI001198B35C|nr:FAD-binding and (Fe-S)-binding domain-containing protein [Salarchaeum sp. JOR-1]QDX39884.1 FAD-binding protein [Salarchaeum sp. JOR-1]